MNKVLLASVLAGLAVATPSLKALLPADAARAREVLCRTGARWTSEEERAALARRLAEAGVEMDPAAFAGLRFALAAGAALALLPFLFLGMDFFWLASLAPLAYFAPNLWLNEKASDRRSAVRLSLADFSVLFSTALSAGADAVTALREAARGVGGPLAQEVERALGEHAVGRDLADALREMAERCNVDELRALVRVISQSHRYGSPLAAAVREHAAQMRMVRRYEVMEAAGKLSVKITVPVLFFILVPVMLALGYPAAVRLLEVFGF